MSFVCAREKLLKFIFLVFDVYVYFINFQYELVNLIYSQYIYIPTGDEILLGCLDKA